MNKSLRVKSKISNKLHDVEIPHRGTSEALWVKEFQRLSVDYNLIHRHEAFEICYCPSNSGHFFINDKEYDISPGDIFIVNGNEFHQPVYDTKENAGATVIYFDPAFLSPYYLGMSWMNVFLNASDASLNRVGKDEEIAQLIGKMAHVFKSLKPNWQNLCWGILSHILVVIEDRVLSSSEVPPHFTSSNGRSRFNAVIQYIKNHIHENIPLNILYDKAHLSKSQFSSLFRQVFNCSLTQYIVKERCKHAAALLKGSDKTVAEIN